MNTSVYRRWACGLLAVLLLLLASCAAVVYTIDPCMYYRIPTAWKPVFFSERYQGAGLAKNVPADTALVGTSMAANYRAGEVGEILDCDAVRITIPDGYLSEFDRVMGVLFREHDLKRVVFLLDLNILVRDESGVTTSMPPYLYNENPLDDVKYLLNKDTLYYSFYVLMANGWNGGQTVDEGFTWDKGIWWNHMTALEEYKRPDIVDTPVDPAPYVQRAKENLSVVERWITEHPDTEFDIVIPPYSILFWDKSARKNETDAMLAGLRQAADTLLPYENVRLYPYLLDQELIENLDDYCDYVHHSGNVCTAVLNRLAAEEGRLTVENVDETIANWREFVLHYDYEKFWDESFWISWNAAHQ